MADETEDTDSTPDQGPTSNKPDTLVDKPTNVISFEIARELLATPKKGAALDDDELVRIANEKIAQWKAAGTPSLTVVQELFHEFDKVRRQSNVPG